MRLNEINYTEALPIDGYGPGFFRIGGQAIEGPIFISDDGVHTWDGYEDRALLLDLAEQVDVLFIGTGAETEHVPEDLRATLEGLGIGVEAMNSPAACRTYNVLLSEGRRIALALLPV
ncbi:hypothetical protein ROA7450_00348 [Roseovarius albus]|uniref:NADH dehydrogenase [ubiquinone] 1 alpha subcomplex assembly factor 3 n=1 Tax=Roseovarius albus TaxID=1247867 RepID=A0A1X6YAK0_9RHOB|nr:Mth938-like domain-containing protein [Roseovarius albus]SLN15421.1 hypothetical protein ROA7450_00348 [Roseovarius albus]